MENKASITEIHRNYGNNIIGIIDASKEYTFSFKAEGRVNVQFRIIDKEDGSILHYINRNRDLIATQYEYRFKHNFAGYLVYTTNEKAKLTNILLLERGC